MIAAIHALIIPMVASLSVVISGPAVHPVYEGIALDLETKMRLYVEEHKESLEDGQRIGLTSVYRDMEGRVLARRTVDFRKSPLMPNYILVDERDGYTEGAEMVGDSVRLFSRKDQNSPLMERTIAIPQPAVVDAGFNNFVQLRWESIEKGEKQYFNFGVPFTQDYYGFRVYKEDERVIDGRNMMVVNLDIDNFIIRLFLDPIVLTYDMDARRLVSYEGISNINNDMGKSHVVRIAYDPYGP